MPLKWLADTHGIYTTLVSYNIISKSFFEVITINCLISSLWNHFCHCHAFSSNVQLNLPNMAERLSKIYTSRQECTQWLETYVLIMSVWQGTTPWRSTMKCTFFSFWSATISPPPWLTHSTISGLWTEKKNLNKVIKGITYRSEEYQSRQRTKNLE